MDEKEIIKEYWKTLVDTQLAIIFNILDFVGLIAVFIWVVDDFQEAVVVIIFFSVVSVGQYLNFRRIRIQLANQESTEPLLEFTKARQAQMFQEFQPNEGRKPTYEVLQAWFINNPKLSTNNSIAKSVTARITVYKLD